MLFGALWTTGRHSNNEKAPKSTKCTKSTKSTRGGGAPCDTLILQKQTRAFWCFVNLRKTYKVQKSTKKHKKHQKHKGEGQHATLTLCWNQFEKAPWSCFLMHFGALWNSRAHSKLHKKHSYRAFWCYLVLYEPWENIQTTKMHQKARKARRNF